MQESCACPDYLEISERSKSRGAGLNIPEAHAIVRPAGVRKNTDLKDT